MPPIYTDYFSRRQGFFLSRLALPENHAQKRKTPRLPDRKRSGRCTDDAHKCEAANRARAFSKSAAVSTDRL